MINNQTLKISMLLNFLPFKPLLHWLTRLLLVFSLMVMSFAVLAATQMQPAKGLLYEVKSGHKIVYLFGSIHLAKASFYPLSPSVEKAYAQAEVVAVEADVTDAEASKLAMPLMLYVAPDQLQEHLSAATWQALHTAVGPALQQFQGLKPAVVAISLTVGAFARLGYDPAHGIDLHFIHRAKADKKKLIELESLDFQARVLAGLSDEEGDALRQTLDALNNGDALHDAENMVTMWHAGDAIGLAKLFDDAANKDAGSKKMMKLLLDDRNLGMSQKISRLLAKGRKAFVVVGAGHLTGANSIVDILTKQGMQVRRIP
jgi:uncharacterized protein YbaP (TraB family)